MWRAVSRNDGQLISHLLIRYIADRETHAARWVEAERKRDPERVKDAAEMLDLEAAPPGAGSGAP